MTRRLPDWLAAWWSGPYSNTNEMVTAELQWTWPWPPWATLLLLVVLVGCVTFFYAREKSSASRSLRVGLAVLRLAVIGLLLLMLTQVAIVLKRTVPPGIAVLVDRSASMQISDTYPPGLNQKLRDLGIDEPTRINLAKQIVTGDQGELLRKLDEKYDLHLYQVASGVERIDGELPQQVASTERLTTGSDTAQSTRLGDAVVHAMGDYPNGPPAALILLTDGVNTAGKSLDYAAQIARRRGVPLYAVGLGSDQPPRDLELTGLLVEDVVFVDDWISFRATVQAHGIANEEVRVVLRHSGQSEVLAEQQVRVGPSGEAVLVQLTNRPASPGEFQYVLEIEPQDDEINLENNRQQHTITVRDEKIRVLFVQGYPSYEFRYLKALLSRDPSIELSTYLQQADADYVAQDRVALPAFPVGRDALFEYDVVLFGDTDPQLLPGSVWPNLQALVEEKGGGIAFLAGPRFMPWGYSGISAVSLLLPVDIRSARYGDDPRDSAAGFSPQLTPLGLRSSAMQLGESFEATGEMWRNLPPIYWLAEVGRLKPAAQVLAEHPTRRGANGQNLPAICFQYFGNGRVLFHATDATWRWRFRTGDLFFARYWVQTIRFLARSKLESAGDVELAVDRQEYTRNQPVEIQLRLGDRQAALLQNSATVLLETSGLSRQRVTLAQNQATRNIYSGVLTGLAPGTYRLMLVDPALPEGTPTAQFVVKRPPGEFAQSEMDRATLTSAVNTTHGEFFTFEMAHTLLDALPAGRRIATENLPPVPLWNHPAVLVLLLTLLIAEWIVRRRVGML